MARSNDCSELQGVAAALDSLGALRLCASVAIAGEVAAAPYAFLGAAAGARVVAAAVPSSCCESFRVPSGDHPCELAVVFQTVLVASVAGW